ncbi:hypothetical protein A3Q56_07618, partial [Intoshia linei]
TYQKLTLLDKVKSFNENKNCLLPLIRVTAVLANRDDFVGILALKIYKKLKSIKFDKHKCDSDDENLKMDKKSGNILKLIDTNVAKSNTRTKLYSGKSKDHTVCSLQELCTKSMRKNLHFIVKFPNLPEDTIKDIIQKANVGQLRRFESYNPNLCHLTDDVWESLVRQKFRINSMILKKNETFRDLYLRYETSENKKLQLLSLKLKARMSHKENNSCCRTSSVVLCPGMSADRIASIISVAKSFDVLIELPILTICIKLVLLICG